MMSGQARRILGLLLVALSLVSVDRAAQAAAGEPQLIRAQSIKGAGEYSNSESLIIDGQMPTQEAEWNGPQCVYWEGAKARFVIAMDGVYRITGLTLQADNNDDYVIEASMDGTTFSPLLVVKGDWGEVFTGMQTLSTLSDDPHFLPQMTIKPVQAKYLKLSARGGDEAYAVSELLVYGSKVQSDSVPPVVITAGGSTPTVTQGALVKPKSIKGHGEFSNAAKLIIDRKVPPEETPWDDPRCVYWTSPQTTFVIDLGEAYWITGLTLQVDLNDTYVVETSMEGKTFTPMMVIDGDWGEIGTGMETLSTIPTDAEFLPEMVLRPVQARYVKLSVRSGDDFYAVSELLIYGSKTKPVLALVLPQPGQSPAVTQGPPGDLKGGLEEAFDALDTNKDGKVSKAEYAAIWKEGVKVDEKFKFFDANGNGFIEREEYLGLPARMKQGAGGQSKSGTTGPTPLEAAKVRQAIDAMPDWARIRELVSAKKMDEVTQIAKDAGFENWPALERYFIVLNTVQASLETNREAAADRLARLYGQETIDIVSEQENMEKIKAYRPK